MDAEIHDLQTLPTLRPTASLLACHERNPVLSLITPTHPRNISPAPSCGSDSTPVNPEDGKLSSYTDSFSSPDDMSLPDSDSDMREESAESGSDLSTYHRFAIVCHAVNLLLEALEKARNALKHAHKEVQTARDGTADTDFEVFMLNPSVALGSLLDFGESVTMVGEVTQHAVEKMQQRQRMAAEAKEVLRLALAEREEAKQRMKNICDLLWRGLEVRGEMFGSTAPSEEADSESGSSGKGGGRTRSIRNIGRSSPDIPEQGVIQDPIGTRHQSASGYGQCQPRCQAPLSLPLGDMVDDGMSSNVLQSGVRPATQRVVEEAVQAPETHPPAFLRTWGESPTCPDRVHSW